MSAPRGVWGGIYQQIFIDAYQDRLCRLYAAARRFTAAEILIDPQPRNGIEANTYRGYHLSAALFEPPILISVNL